MTSYPNIDVVFVAAGLSSRMGQANKLLIDIDGTPLVRRTASIYCDLGMNMIAVLGHEADAVAAALNGLPATRIMNTDYKKGQQSSVRSGLRAHPLRGDGLLIALGDQPYLTKQDIADLCDTFLLGRRDRILVPHNEGVRGNPVLFPSELAQQIQDDGKTPGCRRFIDANPDLVSRYEVNHARFTTDIDTPEDVEHVLNHIRQIRKKAQ